MSDPIKVPRQFHADFDLVAAHYKFRMLGQYEEAREAARGDIESAITTYAAIAKEIQG